MGFFNMRRPQGFRHEYLYVNERRDRLKQMEERVKKELGAAGTSPDREGTGEAGALRLKGAFLEAATHTRRRREQLNKRSWTFNIVMTLVILLVMLMVWMAMIDRI
ncbi:MAG: hypothetical protein PUH24_01550 [Prevotellaceae bacterium]|nr:hypothetical protein [Prevotella sp.]MDD7256963.1 hypothetical protein [Prevotellaceae bacterium]MDY6131402.1 hypothetical protein [Prevotella sp.]